MVVAMGTSVGGAGAASNFSAQTGSTLNPFVFLIIGAGVWMISWMVLEGIGTSLRDEQIKGTLEQNFLAPINRFLLLVGTALAQIVITTILFVSVIAASVLVLAPGNAIGLIWAFGILMVGLIPLFGIGFVFAALVVRFRSHTRSLKLQTCFSQSSLEHSTASPCSRSGSRPFHPRSRRLLLYKT